MLLVDSHTHVQFPAYDGDRDAVIARAKEAGVFMVLVGTGRATSAAGIELSRRIPEAARATVGFHPNHTAAVWRNDPSEQVRAERERFDADALQELAADPHVVAIGECGLDYYRLAPGNAEREKTVQRDVFLAQAGIAVSVGKPLMVHCRPSRGTDDAYEDLLQLFAENGSLREVPKVIHFYVGSEAVTEKFLAHGCYVTFGGVITFARDYDGALKCIPLERILLETDAPYVAPAPHRGKRNEPAYITETAKQLATIKGVSVAAVSAQTTETARALFRLP